MDFIELLNGALARTAAWDSDDNVLNHLESIGLERTPGLEAAIRAGDPAHAFFIAGVLGGWELARQRVSDVRVVFDGPPAPESGRFVEVERASTGESFQAGEWVKREIAPGDDLWDLTLTEVLK